MSAADRMERLRVRRKNLGLKELRFWVREEDLEKAKEITSFFQKLAFYDEEEKKVRDLEKELNFRLEEFQSWKNYMKEKYDFNLKPSTEKQRKFALRLASASEEDIPLFVLRHKGLLGSWIHRKLNT